MILWLQYPLGVRMIVECGCLEECLSFIADEYRCPKGHAESSSQESANSIHSLMQPTSADLAVKVVHPSISSRAAISAKDRPFFPRTIAMIATHPAGLSALVCSPLFRILIRELDELLDDEQMVLSVALSEGGDKVHLRPALMLRLIFGSTWFLELQRLESSGKSEEVTNGPLSYLDSFVRDFVIDEKWSGIPLQEEHHHVGLGTVLNMAGQLNLLVLMDERWEFTKSLTRIQSFSHNSENSELIIDPNSLLRRRLLIHLSRLNEPSVPPAPSTTQSPKSFLPQTSSTCESPSTAELQQIASLFSGRFDGCHSIQGLKQAFELEFLQTETSNSLALLCAACIDQLLVITESVSKWSADNVPALSSIEVNLKHRKSACLVSSFLQVFRNHQKGNMNPSIPTKTIAKFLAWTASVYCSCCSPEPSSSHVLPVDWVAVTLLPIYSHSLYKAEHVFLRWASTTTELHHHAESRAANIPFCVWPCHSSVENQPLRLTTLHLIEFMVERELPHVWARMCMHGVSLSRTCSLWLDQNFWGYLEIDSILVFSTLSILHGLDFQAYFVLAVLKHIQRAIIAVKESNNLVCVACLYAMGGWRASVYGFAFMRTVKPASSFVPRWSGSQAFNHISQSYCHLLFILRRHFWRAQSAAFLCENTSHSSNHYTRSISQPQLC